MKAAIVTAAGKSPIFGEFHEPAAALGMEVITVHAAALSQFSKSRSAGTHYSSEGGFPAVAGADGVGLTADGRRVYFFLPEAPYGSLAEKCLVDASHCVEIPDSLDNARAAAMANPGMSSWVALVERARLQPGETVLINGATGSAGRLAVQIAKYLGAGKVIATGRDERELQELLSLGADAVIGFHLGALHPAGATHYEQALKEVFAQGVNVVVDYLWGESAKTVIVAIAKTVEDATPVRFVHVGGASGEGEIALPGAALRSSAIQLMGSGLKSVPMPKLVGAMKSVLEAAGPAKLQIAIKTMPLSEIEAAWRAPGKPRIVIAIQ
jgi:NADPH:quinone reductase-like Zn-dependent oxidoreductase